MPRVTLGDRLQALTQNEFLPATRRSFAADLLRYYETHKRLTAGRRVWIDRLEEQARENEKRGKLISDPSADILVRIETVLERVDDDWSQGFLESIRDQLKWHNLSQKQIAQFEKIEKENSDAAMLERANWSQEYEEKYKKDFLLIAEYYQGAGYFTNIALKALSDGDYVPPRAVFQKMQNKYSAKVLEEIKRTPKYPPGSSVVPRANAAWGVRQYLAKGGLVLKTDLPVTSAAKGGKKYRILPYGSAEPIECEERWLKALKKRPQKKK